MMDDIDLDRATRIPRHVRRMNDAIAVAEAGRGGRTWPVTVEKYARRIMRLAAQQVFKHDHGSESTRTHPYGGVVLTDGSAQRMEIRLTSGQRFRITIEEVK